ncbi:TetR/AcrR family transcriptional regulator [Plantactinospora mayteni]|uniref:TetR/AcrR family transcriptional regulator n=1 Tax=Plantactinospora mayteni TaxID=566021 RepID=UPI00194298A0|nr:TetR/AcrR family transcriptional regulator [Plantactinospora mayteni]
MTEAPGLRERKKQRTRRELIEAALHLFDTRGYEATTVAEIAAAAEVSRATFSNYFSSKEEIVFADGPLRAELLAEAIERRAPGDPPVSVLLGAVKQLLGASGWSLDPASGLVSVRARLIASVPALRARALLEVAALQGQWSALLVAAFAGELDEVEAAALTGAVIGAVFAVVGHELRQGSTGQPLPELVRRAAALALAAPATG